MDETLFFSLRWKLSILFAICLLCGHGAYSYFAFNEAKKEFEIERQDIQTRQYDTAKILSSEAFLILDQLGEGLALTVVENDREKRLAETLERNWEQWQLIWDLENITLFDASSRLIGSWGRKLELSSSDVLQVLSNEAPLHKVLCPDACYQQVMIPIMGQSLSSGVLSVSQSFADIIIKYKKVTGNDIGILLEVPLASDHGNSFKLSANTFAGLNFDLLGILSRNDVIERFVDRREALTIGDKIYELGLRRINDSEITRSPYFVFVNDMTYEVNGLNAKLKSIWIQGLLNLILSLFLLSTVLWFFLRRVTRLSKAIPLLAGRQYNAFRQQLKPKKAFSLFNDEIDQLNFSVLGLSQQLEFLEQVVNANTLEILEKNRSLIEEKDFISSLVNKAPVIMLTQRMNGMISSANQAAIEALGEDRDTIVGKLFDLYIPASEQQHREELKQLRNEGRTQRLKIEGSLSSKMGRRRDIYWIHALLNKEKNIGEAFVLSMGVDISVDQMIERKMLNVANFDPVTGLGNQKSFQFELADKIASAKRYGGKVALLMFDLVPRSLGNLQFDNTVVVRAASRLKPIMRASDILCRVGENRFALVMPNVQQRGIMVLANKIIQEINALNLKIDAQDVFLSTGIGIAVYPRHGDTVEILMANAQLAMHQAMKDGLYSFFDQEGTRQVGSKQRSEWQVLFDTAFECDLYALSYRQVWNTDRNRVGYYQCRLCIDQPGAGSIQPEQYWQYAEQLGLALRLERLLLVKTVQALAAFNRQNKRFTASINLSGALFSDPDFCSDMADLLRRNEVDPEQIIFEISENYAIGQFVSMQRFVRRVKEYGCKCILNDFGVEFSSFFYLKHLPVDFVSISKVLIDQITKNKADRRYMEAMIEVAQAFDKITVFESVSSSQVFEAVKELGVNYAAGDFIGKPLASPVINKLVG